LRLVGAQVHHVLAYAAYAAVFFQRFPSMRCRVAGIECRNQDERACLCYLPNHERILSLAYYDLFAIGFPSRYLSAGAESLLFRLLLLCFLRCKKTPIPLPSADGGGPVF
jgi:hypothetical protein